MTFDEIERRLRLPAPDEPAVLPALVLPVRIGTAPLSERTIDLRLGRRQGRVPALLLATALLLVSAMIGAVLVGALRVEQLRDALPIPGLYTGRGISVDYPTSWQRFTPHDPIGNSGSNVALIVGNRDVTGCEADAAAVERNSPPPQPTPDESGISYGGDQTGVIYHLEDRIYACLTEQPLASGEVRLVVSRDRPQAIAVGPFGDFEGAFLAPNPELGGPVLISAETGFTDTIGEMPAQLIVRERSVVIGAEQLRTWLVAIPDSAESLWWVQAVLRGPDLPTLEAQVDAVARSLTFDEVPVPLAAADRGAALAMAIDEVDRQMRAYPRARFLACMPRTAGSVEATIEDGPRGRLDAPLDVTCTTTVEDVDLRVWSATIEVAWDAIGDAPAGRWARQVLFGVGGQMLHETDLVPGTGEAAAFPGDPGLPVPIDVPRFQPGDLARSVGAGTGTAFYDVDTAVLPPEPHLFAEPGTTIVILSGPEIYDGRDFYYADNGFETGWVGAEAKGTAVLAAAEPFCPAVIDADELAYIPTMERRLCVSGDVTLGPVRAATIDLDPTSQEVKAEPAWLAAEPAWRLFGTNGVEDLDVGLPVALGPGLIELPTDGWLVVTGHFDDPASTTCSVTYPESWNPAPVPPEAQVRRCLERFVVTSAVGTDAQ